MTKTSNLSLPDKFNENTKKALNHIFFGDEYSIYPSLVKELADFGITDAERYLGLQLAVRMLKDELFEFSKIRPGIENLIYELQKNTIAGATPQLMFGIIIKVAVFELIKTLSIYRATTHSTK